MEWIWKVLPPGFEPESLTCFREAISPRRKANMIDRTTLRERLSLKGRAPFIYFADQVTGLQAHRSLRLMPCALRLRTLRHAPCALRLRCNRLTGSPHRLRRRPEGRQGTEASTEASSVPANRLTGFPYPSQYTCRGSPLPSFQYRP